MTPMPVHLLGLATGVPPFVIDQQRALDLARRLFCGRSTQIERLLPVFTNSGILTRYSCVPLEWYEAPHGWADRNAVYLKYAVDLLEDAARRALAEAGLSVADIGSIVSVSTTGVATPSLDALLMERMGMPRTLRRLPIFGLGCAGGVLGLARAATMAAVEPDKAVLLLVVELCALSFRRDDLGKSNIVATALFGDGAAAAVLSCTGKGPRIRASGEHLWPDSLDIMGWDVMDDGMRAIFSRDIPQLVMTRMGEAVRDFLVHNELQLGAIDQFVCHPGGMKVLDALERIFDLENGAMTDAREVLRDYGNMSAVTVLFVLERLLKRTTSWDRALLTSLGPGFTGAFMVMENA
jgi:alkylresorcinol/alkylpyrone synthase